MHSSSASRFPYSTLVNGKIPANGIKLDSVANLAESSDEALIADVQKVDRAALALLFRRFARSVRSVGQRILRDKAEADDLVQEVFLYVHRKSILFDSRKGTARSWI